MAVVPITTWKELAALEKSWNALAGDMPFHSWDWLATWWKHYGSATRRHADHNSSTDAAKARQLYVLAVYEGEAHSVERNHGNLLGIAPLYLDRTVIKGNVLRWLGSGEICTDHLSLICRPENREQVAASVAEALTTTCDDWDRLDLSAVDADDLAVDALINHLGDRDCLVSRHSADACWTLELPATWDEYLANVSKSHRKQLRQLERRVLESGRVEWHRATSSDDFEEAWETFVDLHQRRRKSLGEPGCFASCLFAEFHREAAGRLLERGQLRLSWLALDGVPAAAEYHVAGGNTLFAYQGGVAPELLAEEPGRLSTILCLRAALDEGQRRIDFLRGDEPYKAHWRAAPQPTFDYRIVPNRRLARLRGRVLTLSNVMTDWMRNVSQPFQADTAL